jgi:peptidoglycan/xylan/chitin deacetylase (PgdA/CDA1 family)
VSWPGSRRRLRERRINRRDAHGLILLYHRVCELRCDPWSLAVSPRHLAEHLSVLRRLTEPVRVSDLAHAKGRTDAARLSVAITFDDGYDDVVREAMPLLEQSAVAGTVFLTVGALGNPYEFWWDELERVFLQPGVLPKVLEIEVNGVFKRWELGEQSVYPEQEFERYRRWRAWEPPPGLRQQLYRDFYDLLLPLRENTRQELLEKLYTWACMERTRRPTHRSLSAADVARLARGRLVEMGAHTVTHPVLATLPPDVQAEEITRSRRVLEELSGQPVRSFAYPYGRTSDYSADTVRLVQEAGLTCACSNFPGIVTERTDRFQLPRFQVQDWDGKEFRSRLLTWIES